MSINLLETLENTGLEALTRLQTFYVESNNIKILENNILGSLKSLTRLYIGNNSIETLERSGIGQISSLQFLFLSLNKIQTIQKYYLNRLTLNTLVLEGNQITDINELGNRIFLKIQYWQRIRDLTDTEA